MNEKRIIVLIPHYNNPECLETSILSIDDRIQVDLLIIDDGSSRKPNEAELNQAYKNGEIYFEYLIENKGLSNALNKGIFFAQTNKYEFIGRLDCGDRCFKNKFSKQLDFLDNNDKIKLLGTCAVVVDEEGNELFMLNHPLKHEEIKKKMYLNNMFVHPTVIIRTNVFKSVEMYDEKYTRAAQDYALFFRIIKKFQVANLPEPLLYYEISSNSISSKRRQLQVRHRIKIILENFYFGFHPIYGLTRNTILFFMSREATTKLKLIFKK
ncbi:glycosyltransferase [Formosa sediminum]|uniref:Glycosyltransferase n=1 Tax=Formosa sediminum TaxID=2594004 RepID=A0A516GVV2_9FLAO|nr:glycosyltransferase [Formosa sediminum]QDO95651.1 glycosyltransferase [Formosa sediminum]